MATTALSNVERAHRMYRDRHYDEALGFYTDALTIAKTKAQKIALHSNRAACFLKLHDFKKYYSGDVQSNTAVKKNSGQT